MVTKQNIAGIGFIACVLLLSAAPLKADILPGNFLPNPSFEEDIDGDGIPDGWLQGGNYPAGDLWDTSEPVTGTYHLTLLDEGDSSYTSWYTNVPIPEGTDELTLQWTWNYVFTSDNPGDEFRMTIAWRSEDIDIGYDHVVVREDEPNYVTERRDWIVPLDADALRLEFVTGGPQTETGVMRIDDVSIAIPGQTLPGDFDANQILDASDIDALHAAIRAGNHPAALDVTGDSLVNQEDSSKWVSELKGTWYGDADLDGIFDSADLVTVLAAGQYEDDIVGNSGWASGDWDGDGDFTSSDLVTALADGGYEQGPRAVVSAVPEPASCITLLVASLGIAFRRRVR
jgi:hypothetical protein